MNSQVATEMSYQMLGLSRKVWILCILGHIRLGNNGQQQDVETPINRPELERGTVGELFFTNLDEQSRVLMERYEPIRSQYLLNSTKKRGGNTYRSWQATLPPGEAANTEYVQYLQILGGERRNLHTNFGTMFETSTKQKIIPARIPNIRREIKISSSRKHARISFQRNTKRGLANQ